MLSQLPAIQIPSGLENAVLARVRDAEIRALQIRIGLSFFGLLASVGTIITSWSSLWAEISGSSFINLIRLGFTDSDVIFANIGSIASGLLESIPVVSVVLALIALFCLIASVAMFQTLRKVRHMSAPHFA